MAKNLGRKYATMSEEERIRFAQEEEEGTRELPAELEFDEPREEHLGRYSTASGESAEPEPSDGATPSDEKDDV
jgi:hypothetical protein